MISSPSTDNDLERPIGSRRRRLEVALGSFKVKLVLYFAFLALLPLAVAFVGFDSLARRSETRRVDARLQAGLRSVIARYGARLEEARLSAERRARDPQLQRALRSGDPAALERAATGDLSLISRGRSYGSRPGLAATRSVTITSGGRTLGRVVVAVPVDGSLLDRLRPGLDRADELVAVRGGKIVAGPHRGRRLPPAGVGAVRVRIGGTDYRALATAPLAEPAGIELALLARQRGIGSAARASERRLLIPLLASLFVFALVTYLLARSIVRTLRKLADAANALASGRLGERVEVRGRDEFAQLGSSFNRMAAELEQRLVELEAERKRLREQRARFGEALGVTLDREQLLRIVVQSAVEETGAYGGVVVTPEGEVARTGDPERGLQTIEVPLQAGRTYFGRLVLRGPHFGEEESEAAIALAAQAVLALENVRLHNAVEEQALVDSLTDLANRRSLERTLARSVAHAGRTHEPVCFVLADLDDFKTVNDRFGHSCGDMVLREFARELEATVREGDVAGRWGGEEFALVVHGADLAGGAALAERARVRLAERELLSPDGEPLHVTASFGVAEFPGHADRAALVDAADEALYRAKADGKNRVATASGAASR